MKMIFLIIFILANYLTSATISGYIKDERTGEPLPFSSVFVEGTDINTMANEKAYYIIHLKAGQYTIRFSRGSYTDSFVNITLSERSNQQINAALKAKIGEIRETVVYKKKDDKTQVNISREILSPNELRDQPQMIEPDLFRSLQVIPGVTAVSDFSSGLYVRGGTPDQNLVLLDGIEIYNVSHLFGVFSTFNMDAIQDVEFLKGGFPAEFGSRTSSVLNVLNKEGNKKEFHGDASLSLIASSLSLEGPIPTGSFLVSGRRTYLDFLTALMQDKLPYYFYDLNGKITSQLGRNDKIRVSGYYGDDHLTYEFLTSEMDWRFGNIVGSAAWDHLYNPQVLSTLSLCASKYKSDILVGSDFVIDNGVKDLTGRLDFEYFPRNNLSFKAGSWLKWNSFYFNEKFQETDYVAYEDTSYYTGMYLQNKYQYADKWILETGGRLDYFTSGKYLKPSPRIGAKYFLSPFMAIKGAWGLYYQFLHVVNPTSGRQGYFSMLDYWFPIDESVKPMCAYHYITGLEWKRFIEHDWELEAYFKDMKNVVEFNDRVEDPQELADFFYHGTGYSYGVELSAEKLNIGRLSYKVSTALSWTTKKLNDFNDEKRFYPRHDKRFNFDFTGDYQLGKKWVASAAFKFATGQPYTRSLGYYYQEIPDDEFEMVIPGDMYGGRLPIYHRLDVGFSKAFKWKGIDFKAHIQVLNVYNHKNVMDIFYNFDTNPPTKEEFTMLPFLPSAGIRAEF
ncbi:MAG: TonB-dependent receptor [Candidatus Coatesbacteria bacterium]|nr:TonB-dependent receptor [Candidatus Coatesbacteria bacterium]